MVAKQAFECNGNIPGACLLCIKGEDSADVLEKYTGLAEVHMSRAMPTQLCSQVICTDLLRNR